MRLSIALLLPIAATAQINRSQCLAPVNTHLCSQLMSNTANLPTCNCYSFCDGVLTSCQDADVFRRCGDPTTFAAGCVVADAGGSAMTNTNAGTTTGSGMVTSTTPVNTNSGTPTSTTNTGTTGVLQNTSPVKVQPTAIGSNAGTTTYNTGTTGNVVVVDKYPNKVQPTYINGGGIATNAGSTGNIATNAGSGGSNKSNKSNSKSSKSSKSKSKSSREYIDSLAAASSVSTQRLSSVVLFVSAAAAMLVL